MLLVHSPAPLLPSAHIRAALPWSRAPDAPPLHGPPLQERLRQLEAAPASERFPPGTRLWVRVAGSGLWPGVAWAFALCKRRDWGQLLLSHRPGEPRCAACLLCCVLGGLLCGSSIDYDRIMAALLAWIQVPGWAM